MSIFQSSEFWSPIWTSLQVAITAEIIVLCLGILAAKWMAKSRFRGKVVIETFLMLPIALPPSVVGFGLLVLFGNQSLIGQLINWLFHQPIIFTKAAAVVAVTVIAFPLMFQSVKNGFEAVDGDIEDAARIDGAGEGRLFISIILPNAYPAILTGVILSFARALGEFGATLMFAGNIPGKTQTIPTAIYVAIDGHHMTLAWLWVISIVIVSFLLLSIVYGRPKKLS
ncbi:molybdate ABC transporter permease subunit [Scopulibacillus darangshiensis]|nr:molybdate ABC transporter permease subunit [Scopulibacillus darangshiensis]